MEITEEAAKKLQERSTEIQQSEQERKKIRGNRKRNGASETCGILAKRLFVYGTRVAEEKSVWRQNNT